MLKRGPRGERNGIRLFQEIKQQGYPGTERSVYRSLKTLKQAEVRASVNPERLRKYSANTAVWLFMRDPKTLEERAHEDLTLFCQASPALSRAYTLMQDFRDMLHRREGARLDTWLEQVTGSDIPNCSPLRTADREG